MQLKINSFTLSTDSSLSSYGIPVLLDARGHCFGPDDAIMVDGKIEWARNMVRDWAESQSLSQEAAKAITAFQHHREGIIRVVDGRMVELPNPR